MRMTEAEPTAATGGAPPDFTAIVERYQRELFAFLRGMVSHDEQARDLLQDTFYDAWRATQREAAPFVPGHAEEEVRRWLYHAAYCRGISARRRARLPWRSLEHVERGDIAENILPLDPSRFEDAVAERDALTAALARLSPEDAACLMLIVVHEFTAAGAAAILGTTAQAVAKRVSRAKQRLLRLYLSESDQQDDQQHETKAQGQP